MRAPKTHVPHPDDAPSDRRISDRRARYNAWRRDRRRKWRNHPAVAAKRTNSISISMSLDEDDDKHVPAAIAAANERYQATITNRTLPAENDD